MTRRRAVGMPEGMYLAAIPESERLTYLKAHPKVAQAVAEAERVADAQILAFKAVASSPGADTDG